MEKEEIKIKGTDLKALYNIYDSRIAICRIEKKLDGDVLFFDLDLDELVDFHSYEEVGFKLLRDDIPLFNPFREYTVEELLEEQERYNDREERPVYDSKSYMDLSWVQDRIEERKYNYDLRYPVEQIEIRYSEIFDDYLFLYVEFDHKMSKLAYMDLTNGREVEQKVLDIYTYYPRDEILRQDSYSPKEIIQLKEKMHELDARLQRRK